MSKIRTKLITRFSAILVIKTVRLRNSYFRSISLITRLLWSTLALVSWSVWFACRSCSLCLCRSIKTLAPICSVSWAMRRICCMRASESSNGSSIVPTSLGVSNNCLLDSAKLFFGLSFHYNRQPGAIKCTGDSSSSIAYYVFVWPITTKDKQEPGLLLLPSEKMTAENTSCDYYFDSYSHFGIHEV